VITLNVNYTGQPEEIQVAEDDVITFPRGLVGCADWRRFVLLSDDEAPGLHILQSLATSPSSISWSPIRASSPRPTTPASAATISGASNWPGQRTPPCSAR
jgi:hypothetical protein